MINYNNWLYNYLDEDELCHNQYNISTVYVKINNHYTFCLDKFVGIVLK